MSVAATLTSNDVTTVTNVPIARTNFVRQFTKDPFLACNHAIVSAKRDPTHVFSRFQIFTHSTSPLHIASYALTRSCKSLNF